MIELCNLSSTMYLCVCVCVSCGNVRTPQSLIIFLQTVCLYILWVWTGLYLSIFVIVCYYYFHIRLYPYCSTSTWDMETFFVWNENFACSWWIEKSIFTLNLATIFARYCQIVFFSVSCLFILSCCYIDVIKVW